MPTVQDIRAKAGEEPVTVLTAYDAPTARVVEEAGIDAILVGDTVGQVELGYDFTIPVTFEAMKHHTAAVVRGTEEAVVVADMPFLSYGTDLATGVENGGRLVKEAGADAVKFECGPHTVGLTERLVEVGVPVMAHLGLTPQREKQLGGYKRQATTRDSARELIDLAREHEAAGAFALVLESVPANVARQATEALSIPTIGIGAGPDTDGQVLVVNDVLGMGEWAPPVAEQFGDVRSEMERAVTAYREAVEEGSFPAEEHTYTDDSLDDL
ncbi:MAG: 3-methyl-2-oxobutanoate hydroxymethyltransferase [Halobacteriaceae archaeon]